MEPTKYEQKIFTVNGDHSRVELQKQLNDGWSVKHAVAQSVSISASGKFQNEAQVKGDVFFILSRKKQ